MHQADEFEKIQAPKTHPSIRFVPQFESASIFQKIISFYGTIVHKITGSVLFQNTRKYQFRFEGTNQRTFQIEILQFLSRGKMEWIITDCDRGGTTVCERGWCQKLEQFLQLEICWISYGKTWRAISVTKSSVRLIRDVLDMPAWVWEAECSRFRNCLVSPCDSSSYGLLMIARFCVQLFWGGMIAVENDEFWVRTENAKQEHFETSRRDRNKNNLALRVWSKTIWAILLVVRGWIVARTALHIESCKFHSCCKGETKNPGISGWNRSFLNQESSGRNTEPERARDQQPFKSEMSKNKQPPPTSAELISSHT